MIDFINTNTFRDFADFVIHYGDQKFFTTDILKQNAIIYCKTDHIQDLFKNLAFSGRSYILITHASDYSIDATKFNSRPNCIKKWFGENIKYDHPDLISIPIGLTPHKHSDKTGLDINWFVDNLERFKNKEKDKKVLYCNWYTANNISKRSNIFDKLKTNNIEYIWDYQNFPSNLQELLEEQRQLIKQGKTDYHRFNELLNYYGYCEAIASHKFIVSPPGNGEDCHRTWEALYVGSFPIVLKSLVFKGMDELPIIQVNDYSEVTYDLLYSYLNKEYNLEKLSMGYWKKYINEEFSKLQ